jgi:hypothetical protein
MRKGSPAMFLSEDIENFMEVLVDEEFNQLGLAEQYHNDYVQDLYCLTLNNLRPKYVRYSIDVRMNMTSQERLDASKAIREAISRGQEILRNDRRKQREA